MVSILLPFYRVEPGAFHDAIRSIAEQTLQAWELILIDNNADSPTREVADEWSRRDIRIRIVEEPTQGIAFALNCGLREAQYDLIARMDADDVAHPERLEKQVAYANAHPAIGVVATQTTFDSAITQSEGYAWFVNWQNSIITPEAHAIACFVESPVAHPTVLFRKSLIAQYGPYSTENVPEDYELWLRWFHAGVQFYKIPEPLLVWKDHPQRLSRNHPNYSENAFWQVKCHYLALWLRDKVAADQKIVVCGAGKLPRSRAALLEQEGIAVAGFTDVKMRQTPDFHFISLSELKTPGEYFLLSFIAKRGVGHEIARHFSALGFVEGRDFLIC